MILPAPDINGATIILYTPIYCAAYNVRVRSIYTSHTHTLTSWLASFGLFFKKTQHIGRMTQYIIIKRTKGTSAAVLA